MIGSLVLAAIAMQGGADTTRASRTAYTTCLRQFVDRSMSASMTQEAFDAAFPEQCGTQRTAYRASVIARESALRATRANAEETADLEIEDSQVNQRDMFLPPRSAPATQQAAATPAPAPASAATPAPTPASQPQ